MHFIKVQLFIDQNKRSKGQSSYGSASMPPPVPKVPLLDWKKGYVIKSVASAEEFTIKEIKSKDGAMHNEDCSVVLVGNDGEMREPKASSMRSGRYEFVSYGDAVPPAPPPTAEPPMRDDCMPMTVNIACIREYYPRKMGEGTRILMADKTAYIVADECNEVTGMIIRAGGYIAGSTPNGIKVIGETNAADPIGGVA
jgi:hypothetical protein